MKKDIPEDIAWYEKAAAIVSLEAYLSLWDIYADDSEKATK